MWLLLAVEVTSLLRRSLPNKIWRRVHVLSLPLYGMASMHFVLAGTEGAMTVMRLVVLPTSVVVLALTGERITRLSRSTSLDLSRPHRDAVPQHHA